MKVGLIGPPQSGKSALFAAVTGHRNPEALAQQECSAVIQVPDPRLDHVAATSHASKISHATIEVWDFPGITSSDEAGRQQYRKHLPHIRLCDVLVAVLRNFQSDAVAAHKGRIDPAADLRELSDDFIFGDLEAVAARIERIEAALKKPTRTHEQEKKELALLQRCQLALEDIKPLSSILEHEEEAAMLRSFAFLTEKPLLVVVNVSEDHATDQAALQAEHAYAVITVCADTEAQIAELDNDEDRAAFLNDLGIDAPARDRLIQHCYEAGGLISFLTSNPNEARAWQLPKGSSAVEAAGKVHTDMARGFIRAETVAYSDFADADGDLKAVKAAGKLRQEGKSYIVQDGDVINFKFNV